MIGSARSLRGPMRASPGDGQRRIVESARSDAADAHSEASGATEREVKRELILRQAGVAYDGLSDEEKVAATVIAVSGSRRSIDLRLSLCEVWSAEHTLLPPATQKPIAYDPRMQARFVEAAEQMDDLELAAFLEAHANHIVRDALLPVWTYELSLQYDLKLMPRSEEQHMYDFEYLEVQPPAPPPKKVNVKRKPRSSSPSPVRASASGQRKGDGESPLSPGLLNSKEMTTIFDQPSGLTDGKGRKTDPAWPQGANLKGWKASYTTSRQGDGRESPWGRKVNWNEAGWMSSSLETKNDREARDPLWSAEVDWKEKESSPGKGSGMESSDPFRTAALDWKGKKSSVGLGSGVKAQDPFKSTAVDWKEKGAPKGAGWKEWGSPQSEGADWTSANSVSSKDFYSEGSVSPQPQGSDRTGQDAFPAESAYNEEWESLDPFLSDGSDEDLPPLDADLGDLDSLSSYGTDSEELELLQPPDAGRESEDSFPSQESHVENHESSPSLSPSSTSSIGQPIFGGKRKTGPNETNDFLKTAPSRRVNGPEGWTPSPRRADSPVRPAIRTKSPLTEAMYRQHKSPLPKKNLKKLLARMKLSPHLSPQASPSEARTPSPSGSDRQGPRGAATKSAARGKTSTPLTGALPRNDLAKVRSARRTSPSRPYPFKEWMPSSSGVVGLVRPKATTKTKSSSQGALSSPPTGSFPKRGSARVKSPSHTTSSSKAYPLKARTPSPAADGRVRPKATTKSSKRGVTSPPPTGSVTRKGLPKMKSSTPRSPGRDASAKGLSSTSWIRTKGRKLSPAS